MLKAIQDIAQKYSKSLLSVFIVFWCLLNLLQAYTTGLHADEAYYWVYAQFLDWGYFDHPPMVALFIKAGSFFTDNPLGIRLFSTITSALSIYFLWLIIKKYTHNIQLFVLLFCSVLIFHVYAFIITPDAPLFFFTTLFLLTYQKYLEKDNWKTAVLLGLICAALLLSKYHGILLIFFVLLSNLKLFKTGSFYIVLSIALLVFLPHLYWQYQNDFPSVNYHLFDRSASPYKFEYTAQYFLDQLLMMGPLVGWLLFYSGYKQKANDSFLRALKFIAYGVLIFFFFSTFKGRVQAHWPLIEFIPLFILSCIYLSTNNHLLNKKVQWLFFINIALILIARSILISTPEALKKIKFLAPYNDYDLWAQEIKKVAGAHYVLFQDGFQNPSYYNYYTQSTKGLGYNSINYRKTQYDLWPIADSTINKKVLLVSTQVIDSAKNFEVINTTKGEFIGTWIENFKYYPSVNFIPQNYEENWKPSEIRSMEFVIENAGNHDMELHKAKKNLFYCIMKDGKIKEHLPLNMNYKRIVLKAKSKSIILLTVKAPKEKGDYKLIISIRTDPFAGTRNSKFINMNIN